MIFYTFTFITLLLEILLTVILLISLIKIDLKINKLDNIVKNNQLQIQEIAELYRKISNQLVELSKLAVQNIKKGLLDFVRDIFAQTVNQIIFTKLFKKFKKATSK